MKGAVVSIAFCIAIALLLFADSAAALNTVPMRTVTVLPSTMPILTLNTTNTSIAPRPVFFAATTTLSPAAITAALEALKTGPMVYVAGRPAQVIDSSAREAVATIRSDEPDSSIPAIGVSPDGQYVYIAIAWSVTAQDSLGPYNEAHCAVVRLNASTQVPIDHFSFDWIRPEHMAVAPDGKVYLGYQEARYPDHAGVEILDFSQKKRWYLTYEQAMIMNVFAFSPDGGHVYYAGWWSSPGIYDLDWSVNNVHYYPLPGDDSVSASYTRSIAVGAGGRMVYAVVNRNKGIFAMNTEDKNKQVIPTDYVPVTLATSPDRSTLYVIGYFYNQDNQPVYVMHKYTGLKAVGPFYTSQLDYSVTDKAMFYTTDAMDYLTPSEGYPSYMAVTADGKYAYITLGKGDGVSDGHGSSVMVYDLEYLHQVSEIPVKNAYMDVAASPAKILFTPENELQPDTNTPAPDDPHAFLVKKTYPANGSYASLYQKDFFNVNAIFTAKLDNMTVSNATFTVAEKSGTPVAGKVSSAQNIVIFMPTSQLKPNTDYVATITTGLKSVDGYALAAPLHWTFTTRAGLIGFTNLSIATSNVTLIRPSQPRTFPIIFPNQTNDQLDPSNQPNQTIPQTSNPIVPQQRQGTLHGGVDGGSQTDSGTPSNARNTSPSKNVTASANRIPPAGGETVPATLNERQDINRINPQPEPPNASPGFLGRIAALLRSLFGMK